MATSIDHHDTILPITYPYPSHAFVPCFVTVKLSGKDMYGVWKTQMLCLLESHEMLGFINGALSPPESSSFDVVEKENVRLWRRSDALVKGWILGSISVEAPAMINVFRGLNSTLQHSDNFTAKKIWDQLEIMFGSSPPAADLKEVRAGSGAKFQGSNENGKLEDIFEMVDKYKEPTNRKRDLYVAAERGGWRNFEKIFKTSKLQITDQLGVNGNTALHIAVTNVKAEASFLQNMLKQLEDKIQLSHLQNSDGSTLLHIAASVGNNRAVDTLVDRSPELMFAKDKKDCTPLDIILSNPMSEKMCLKLLELDSKIRKADVEQEAGNITSFDDTRIEEYLAKAISCKKLDLARTLLRRQTKPMQSDAVLMAIAQNWDFDLGLYASIIYEVGQQKGILELVTRASLGFNGDNIWDQKLSKLIDYVFRIVLLWPVTKLIRILMWLNAFNLNKKFKLRDDAKGLLDAVCASIKHSNDPSSYNTFYTKPLLEAVRQDAYSVVDQIMFWFPEAIRCTDEDGHNLVQTASKNRSLEVISLIIKKEMAKYLSWSQKLEEDPCGNDFLHYAARLAPAEKLNLIPGPTFKLQQELLWFERLKTMVPVGMKNKNNSGDTPQMVFTKEHEKLVTEGTEWMKNSANSYIITDILIIAIVFAGAITVPGGNSEEQGGAPYFNYKPAFIVFIVSIGLSLVTSMISLLFFLSITTSRFAEQDFHSKLPAMLMTGLMTLFLSATFMIVAFGATLFLMFGDEYPWTLALIAPLAFLPVGIFVIYQSRILVYFWDSKKPSDATLVLTRVKVLGRIYI